MTNIIALPTAAAIAPVQPARRGRYPRMVVHIQRGRDLLHAERERQSDITRALAAASEYQASAAKARAWAAELQSKP